MCSICGGTRWDSFAKEIWERSRDRGRDDFGQLILPSGRWIANRRATPTTEVQNPSEGQPVGKGNWKYVFNGMISNDKELGVQEGEADTSVLPRVLSPTLSGPASLVSGLCLLKGSYAIAAMNGRGLIYLACNYKPLWIAQHKGAFYFSSLKQHFPSLLHPWRMQPYSAQSLTKNDSVILPRKQSEDALVICSSGLDSTCVAVYAKSKHRNVKLLHYLYGCRAEKREKQRILLIAEYLQMKCVFLHFDPGILGKSSSLLKKKDKISGGIAGTEYAHEWVPARNLTMLAMATSYAEAHNIGHIYIGTNLEEGGAYPDNEEQFLLDFNALLYGAVQEGCRIELHSPLGGLMKHEIVQFGVKLHVPFDLTWSCYRAGRKPCGNCGPCFMRREAFRRNGMEDPLQYEKV